VASNSTRSPLNSTFSGSQATVSPLVWPRPGRICTFTLPSHSVILPVKVSVGQVSPSGTLSTLRNRRGKRPISLALSCSPRSTIRS
jgi:hypothetical protein